MSDETPSPRALTFIRLYVETIARKAARIRGTRYKDELAKLLSELRTNADGSPLVHKALEITADPPCQDLTRPPQGVRDPPGASAMSDYTPSLRALAFVRLYVETQARNAARIKGTRYEDEMAATLVERQLNAAGLPRVQKTLEIIAGSPPPGP